MPLDSTIEKQWEDEMKEAKEYTRKLNIISTKEKEPEDSEPEKESLQERVSRNSQCLGVHIVLTFDFFTVRYESEVWTL